MRKEGQNSPVIETLAKPPCRLSREPQGPLSEREARPPIFGLIIKN